MLSCIGVMQVWVLDATPGKVRSGGDGEDHPGELIATLRRMPPMVKIWHSLICCKGVFKFGYL